MDRGANTMLSMFGSYKNSLKIPMRKSIFVNRRRTENAMAKGKSTKGQTNDLQNIHI